jgi:hypothetical protein
VTDPTSNPSNELSDDELRKLFLWCREHTQEPDALTTLNDMGPILLRPSVGKEMIETVNAIVDTLENDKEPSAHIHAHMMILLSTLLEHRTQRDAFDKILLRWIRHPASFGPARATPPELQREAFVQRLADALGWNAISVTTDRDAIARFLAWIDTWAPKQKSAAGRIIGLMRRNFPEGGELWRLVRYEAHVLHGPKGRPTHGNNNQGRRQHNNHNRNNRPNPAAKSSDAVNAEGTTAAEGVTGDATAAPDGAQPTADASTTSAPGEGKRRRNRRRRRNHNHPNAGTDGSTADASGSSDVGDDHGSESETGSTPVAHEPAAVSSAPTGDASSS